MQITSRHRLQYCRETQINSRHHQLKLEQIKQSKPKQTIHVRLSNIKGRFQNSEKKKKIQKDNRLMFTRLSMIINRPVYKQKLILIPHHTQKPAKEDLKVPNINQKSFYSIERMKTEWVQRKQYLRIASRLDSQRNTFSNKCKYNQKELSQKQKVFQQLLELSQGVGLSQASETMLSKPQQLIQRIIITRKTKQINNISYLIEISTAFNKIFILAHNMQDAKNPVIRLKMDVNKARKLFQGYQYDFNQFINSLKIEANTIKLKMRKLKRIDSDNTQQSSLSPIVSRRKNIKLDKNYSFYRQSQSLILRSQQKQLLLQEQINKPEHERKITRRKFSSSKQMTKQKAPKRRYQTQANEDKMKKFSIAVTMKKSKQQLNNTENQNLPKLIKTQKIIFNTHFQTQKSDDDIEQQQTDLVMDLKETKKIKILQFVNNRKKNIIPPFQEITDDNPQQIIDINKTDSHDSELQKYVDDFQS